MILFAEIRNGAHHIVGDAVGHHLARLGGGGGGGCGGGRGGLGRRLLGGGHQLEDEVDKREDGERVHDGGEGGGVGGRVGGQAGGGCRLRLRRWPAKMDKRL